MKKITIVGTGLAGYTVARELRKLDTSTQLTLVTADDGAFYSKPMLSNAFAQGKTPQSLINFHANQMANQLNATVLTNTVVAEIDSDRRNLRCDDKRIEYDQLVLALGARPVRLPVKGSAADAVLSVNSLLDYGQFRASIASVKRVLLVGGGLIGCEFANDLVRGGYAVTLVHLGQTLLDGLVPAAIGRGLQAHLVAAGVEIITGTTVTTINRSGSGAFAASLAIGREVETDCTLSAIGLAPVTNLATGAGLQVKRGVVTNNFLETSHPGIYAVGDCAEVDGTWQPYVMPIMNQARALAKTLHGEKTSVIYPIMPVVVKTPAYPVVVVVPSTTHGTWQSEDQADGAKALFWDAKNQLRGFALGGRCAAEKAALAKQIIV